MTFCATAGREALSAATRLPVVSAAVSVAVPLHGWLAVQAITGVIAPPTTGIGADGGGAGGGGADVEPGPLLLRQDGGYVPPIMTPEESRGPSRPMSFHAGSVGGPRIFGPV
jgi:hypothetical protein